MFPFLQYHERDMAMGRLANEDKPFVEPFLEENPGFDASKDDQSFAYSDVIRHLPIQRTHHQTRSYAYRTNQMVKHAFEDGHMNLAQLTAHTDLMYAMSDREAFQYAHQNLNFR